MPKIAYLTPFSFTDESRHRGGVGYSPNLSRGVVRASGGNYQVEWISFGSSPSRIDLAPGVSLRVLTAAREPTNPLDVLSWDLPEALADADLVHIHQAYTRCTEVGLLVAKSLRKPVCVTDLGASSSIIGRHYGLMDLADQIVAVSNVSASGFEGRKPVEVIRGGVDADAFRPSSTLTIRSHVLYVGSILDHKGIDQLIRVLPAGMPLVVCSRAHGTEECDRLRELAQDQNVRFIIEPRHDDIVGLYQRALVTIIPSFDPQGFDNEGPISELSSVSLLESMACGTPAIGPNQADLSEFIRNGETGFVFDSIDELRDQLERLVGTPALVERMGAEARRSIETEFSLDVAGAKLMRLYNRLLSAPKERGAAA